MHGKEKVTRRPYLTLLIDAYCRKILAHYITFDSPSYRSIMMVLRECKKERKTSKQFGSRWGKEFHSLYFDVLCAQYNINKKERPPTKARFGSVIERLFGVTNSYLYIIYKEYPINKRGKSCYKEYNQKLCNLDIRKVKCFIL